MSCAKPLCETDWLSRRWLGSTYTATPAPRAMTAATAGVANTLNAGRQIALQQRLHALLNRTADPTMQRDPHTQQRVGGPAINAAANQHRHAQIDEAIDALMGAQPTALISRRSVMAPCSNVTTRNVPAQSNRGDTRSPNVGMATFMVKPSSTGFKAQTVPSSVGPQLNAVSLYLETC